MRKLLLLAILATGTALAVPITWNLQNVTFTDGGTATGWFVYDNSVSSVLGYDISVSGGNTGTFPPFVYENGAPGNIGAIQFVALGDTVINFQADGSRQLRFAAPSFPDTGGLINIDLSNAYVGECYNCDPFRGLATGQLLGVAPEPSTGPIMGFAILLLGFVGSLRVRARRTQPVR